MKIEMGCSFLRISSPLYSEGEIVQLYGFTIFAIYLNLITKIFLLVVTHNGGNTRWKCFNITRIDEFTRIEFHSYHRRQDLAISLKSKFDGHMA